MVWRRGRIPALAMILGRTYVRAAQNHFTAGGRRDTMLPVRYWLCGYGRTAQATVSPRGLLALLPLEVAGHGLVPRIPSRVPRGIGPCPSSPECPESSVKGGVDDQRKGPTQLGHFISADTVAAVDRRSTFFRRYHPPNRTKALNIPNIWHRRGVFGISHHDTTDRAIPLEVNLHGQSKCRTPYPSSLSEDYRLGSTNSSRGG